MAENLFLSASEMPQTSLANIPSQAGQAAAAESQIEKINFLADFHHQEESNLSLTSLQNNYQVDRASDLVATGRSKCPSSSSFSPFRY